MSGKATTDAKAVAPAKKAAAPARTAAKKATVRRTEPKAKAEETVYAPVGSTVEIEVADDATSVVVERPDGSEVTVAASGGRALYVVDQFGPHIMGGLKVRAVEAVLEV